MSKPINFEVPTITETEFFDSLFKPTDSYGDLFTRATSYYNNCERCPFKEKCDKIYNFFESQDVLVYCEDMIDIMLGQKTVDDYLNKK
jgi:hypothetical protein